MHRTRLSTLLGATAAAATLVLTAGCGSSGTSTDAKADSSASSSASSKDSGDKAAALTESDIFSTLTDAQKDAGSYKFKLTSVGGSGEGQADVSGDTPNVSVTFGAAGQQIETRQVDGIFYFKGKLFGTDKWIKIDPKSKQGEALVGQLGTSDPADTLKSLGDAAEVKKVGSKTIDGDETTQYDVTVPSSALAKNAKMNAETAKLLPKEITYQLFVGDKNLLRQLVIDLEVSGQKATTTIDFTDYGSQVDVSAPPASETDTNFKFPGTTP